GEDGIAGNSFRVNYNDVLTSVSMYLSDTNGIPASGIPVYLTIHPQANDTVHPDKNTILATTDTITLMPGLIQPGGEWFTFDISGSGLAVTPGLYFIGFHEDSAMLAVGYSNQIYTPGSTWFYYNSNTLPQSVDGWSHLEDVGYQITPMIRANFGTTVGMASVENNKLEVYPNPSAGLFNFRLTGNEIKRIEVYNYQGQMIKKMQVNGTSAILDLSSMADGVYQTIIYNQNTRQRKVLMKFTK